MFAYATLLALKQKFGYRVFMEAYHLEHLSYFFKNISQVESLEKLCDEEKSYKWLPALEGYPDIGNENFRVGKYLDFCNKVSNF